MLSEARHREAHFEGCRILVVEDDRKVAGFIEQGLKEEGHVVDVDLKVPSGCPGLDEEAIAAFKRVAHFPHPPAGIFVAPDGSPRKTARYPVRFIVTFDGGLRLDWR
mgnify:CR=1 FL=1